MRGQVTGKHTLHTFQDAQILVCGAASSYPIGASTTTSNVPQFEPIHFKDPKRVEQFESIQCFPSTGNHYIILATFVPHKILTT